MIKKVIAQMESEDGWVGLGEVGKRLTNLAPDFDPRTYGSRKLSDLVRKTNAFEIEQPKAGGTTRIRIKPLPDRLRRREPPENLRGEGDEVLLRLDRNGPNRQQSVITGMAAVRFWYKAAGWLKTPIR